MNIRIYKEDIIDGLQKAAGIIPTGSGAVYLRSIWLKAENGILEIMSTDSSIEFKGAFTAEVLTPGLTGVSGRAFVDLIGRLSTAQISLTQNEEDKTLTVEQGRRKYKLPVNDATWFQNFSDFPESAGSVIWSGDYIQDLIAGIIYCIGDENAKDAFSCLNIKPAADGKIEACGLNGHQFAMQSFLHDDLHAIIPKEGILINKKYLGALQKWLGLTEFELSLNEKRLFFRSNNKKEVFSIPLSSYTFPDYIGFLSKIKGEDISTLKVNRKEMVEALDRLLVFTSESNRCTYLDFSSTPKELVLSSTGQSAGSGTEILDMEYKGNIDKISFPTRNLKEMLAHYTSKDVTFVMGGIEGPCGIFGEDDAEYTAVIMPMKISVLTYYDEENV
jgi:DNA polymerase-3 subunit beta